MCSAGFGDEVEAKVDVKEEPESLDKRGFKLLATMCPARHESRENSIC